MEGEAADPHQTDMAVTGDVKKDVQPATYTQPTLPARSPKHDKAGVTMSPCMMACMFMLVAAASSAATFFVPFLLSQGGLKQAYQNQGNPNLLVSIVGWLSLPEMRRTLYDSLGRALAYLLLSEIAAAAVRTVLTSDLVLLPALATFSGPALGKN